MTGIMSEWVMSTIEDSLTTPRVMRSVQEHIEASKNGREDIVEI